MSGKSVLLSVGLVWALQVLNPSLWVYGTLDSWRHDTDFFLDGQLFMLRKIDNLAKMSKRQFLLIENHAPVVRGDLSFDLHVWLRDAGWYYHVPTLRLKGRKHLLPGLCLVFVKMLHFGAFLFMYDLLSKTLKIGFCSLNKVLVTDLWALKIYLSTLINLVVWNNLLTACSRHLIFWFDMFLVTRRSSTLFLLICTYFRTTAIRHNFNINLTVIWLQNLLGLCFSCVDWAVRVELLSIVSCPITNF